MILGMKSCSDATLLYKTIRKRLIGLCATYGDDALHAANDDYSKLCEKTEENFQCKNREWDDIQFSGLQIINSNNGYGIHQKH